MDTVLLFAARVDARTVAMEEYRLLIASTPAELSRQLVAEPGILGLVVLTGGSVVLPEEFLASLQASFPVLPVLTLPRQPSAGELAGLQEQLSSLRRMERRERRRYDWPLRGFLRLPGGEEGPYNLRSLSATGAFLVCPGGCPPAGSRGCLRVLFQNFSLTTECETLDSRRSSSNLPAGFGVRFTGLAPETGALLDRIICDALVRSLEEPTAPPGIPSLDGEELLPGGLELL
jgi:hypothetical protein